MAKRVAESAAATDVGRGTVRHVSRRPAVGLEQVIRSAGIALLIAGDALPESCFCDPAVQRALEKASARGVAVRILVGEPGLPSAFRFLGKVDGTVRVAPKAIGLLYAVADSNNIWLGAAPRQPKPEGGGVYRDSIRSARLLLEHFERSFNASPPAGSRR
jgi:hypothetical protein